MSASHKKSPGETPKHSAPTTAATPLLSRVLSARLCNSQVCRQWIGPGSEPLGSRWRQFHVILTNRQTFTRPGLSFPFGGPLGPLGLLSLHLGEHDPLIHLIGLDGLQCGFEGHSLSHMLSASRRFSLPTAGWFLLVGASARQSLARTSHTSHQDHTSDAEWGTWGKAIKHINRVLLNARCMHVWSKDLAFLPLSQNQPIGGDLGGPFPLLSELHYLFWASRSLAPPWPSQGLSNAMPNPLKWHNHPWPSLPGPRESALVIKRIRTDPCSFATSARVDLGDLLGSLYWSNPRHASGSGGQGVFTRWSVDHQHLSQIGDILLEWTLQTYSCFPASFQAKRHYFASWILT